MTIQALNPESLVERMIAELNENPEARRLLLRALLTDEFLALPDKVDTLTDKVDGLMHLPAKVERLEEDVSDLKAGQAALQAGQARTQGQIAELQAGQDEMREDIDLLKSGQSRMEGQIGNLRGKFYEDRMRRHIKQTAYRSFDMRVATVLLGHETSPPEELSDKVDAAARRGLITAEQGNRLTSADIVISGTRKSDQSPVHAVVEASITIGESDIIRAAERAATLAAVMGEPAMGVVIGSRISEPDRRRAERSDVIVTIIRE